MRGDLTQSKRNQLNYCPYLFQPFCAQSCKPSDACCPIIVDKFRIRVYDTPGPLSPGILDHPGYHRLGAKLNVTFA